MVKSGALWPKVGPRRPEPAMLNSNFSSSFAFVGEFHHSLDGKKRVTIPSVWRQGETDRYYLIPSLSKPSLSVMPPEVFRQIGEEAKSSSASPALYREFVSNLFAMAKFVETDKQGRLLLPEEFCLKRDLVGDTILTGANDRIEIWSPANWAKYKEQSNGAFEQIARNIGL